MQEILEHVHVIRLQTMYEMGRVRELDRTLARALMAEFTRSWPNQRYLSGSTQGWLLINPSKPTSSRASWRVLRGGSGWCLQVWRIHLPQLEWVYPDNGPLPSERQSRRQKGGSFMWDRSLTTCYLLDSDWITIQIPKQGGWTL